MTSIAQLNKTIDAAVRAQVAGLSFNSKSIVVQTGIGWPNVQTLQNNVRIGPTYSTVISIYDRKMAKPSTRWAPKVLNESEIPVTLVSTLSDTTANPTDMLTITLSGTLTVGNAVSLVANNRAVPIQVGAVAVITENMATLDDVASALADAINADELISPMVSATSSGAVVMITNLASTPLVYSSNVGGTASRTEEVGRVLRQYQIVVWSPTAEVREIVCEPLESWLMGLDADFGMTFSDGTFGRVQYAGDYDIEDATLFDTYRRDFLMSIDYGITRQDVLYSVLAPVVQYGLGSEGF